MTPFQLILFYSDHLAFAAATGRLLTIPQLTFVATALYAAYGLVTQGAVDSAITIRQLKRVVEDEW